MKIFLEKTDDTLVLQNNNVKIYGAIGEQIVQIASGVVGTMIDSNVEGIKFDGSIGDYAFKQSGTNLEIYDRGRSLVAEISLQDDSDGTKLTFADKNTSAIFSPTPKGLFLSIDGQTVSTSLPSALVSSSPQNTPTYKLSSDAPNGKINEDGSVTFTLITTNVAEGTNVPFKFSGSINDDDVLGGLDSNPVFTVEKDGTATFSTYFVDDGIVESPENLTITLINATGVKQTVVVYDAIL